VEQELLTLLKHLSSPLVYSADCVVRFLVFSVVFSKSFVLLANFCLSFDLRLDYLFGIFKLFLLIITI